MGARRRLILAVACAALALSGTACKRKRVEGGAPAPSSSADHLTKGEIPEGSQRAFTLALPLHSAIKATFPGSVHVASAHSYEELAVFVKARIKDGKTRSSSSETMFEQVVATRDASKTLTIQVLPAPIVGEYKSQMVVTDVTPAPEPPGLTDADRWRKAGLTPDGKQIDRTQRE